MNHQELIEQLGGNRFIAMTGAKNFIGGENTLSFKIGQNPKRITGVWITLNPLDLYDITFLTIRKKKTGLDVKKKEVNNVYDDMLQAIFTEQTGLQTHL